MGFDFAHFIASGRIFFYSLRRSDFSFRTSTPNIAGGVVPKGSMNFTPHPQSMDNIATFNFARGAKSSRDTRGSLDERRTQYFSPGSEQGASALTLPKIGKTTASTPEASPNPAAALSPLRKSLARFTRAGNGKSLDLTPPRPPLPPPAAPSSNGPASASKGTGPIDSSAEKPSSRHSLDQSLSRNRTQPGSGLVWLGERPKRFVQIGGSVLRELDLHTLFTIFYEVGQGGRLHIARRYGLFATCCTGKLAEEEGASILNHRIHPTYPPSFMLNNTINPQVCALGEGMFTMEALKAYVQRALGSHEGDFADVIRIALAGKSSKLALRGHHLGIMDVIRVVYPRANQEEIQFLFDSATAFRSVVTRAKNSQNGIPGGKGNDLLATLSEKQFVTVSAIYKNLPKEDMGFLEVAMIVRKLIAIVGDQIDEPTVIQQLQMAGVSRTQRIMDSDKFTRFMIINQNSDSAIDMELFLSVFLGPDVVLGQAIRQRGGESPRVLEIHAEFARYGSGDFADAPPTLSGSSWGSAAPTRNSMPNFGGRGGSPVPSAGSPLMGRLGLAAVRAGGSVKNLHDRHGGAEGAGGSSGGSGKAARNSVPVSIAEE